MANITKHEGYSLPRPDEQTEKTRLDLQHQKWFLTLNDRLFTSSVPNNARRILDVGTGSGSWAEEVARLFPGAETIGTDVTLPAASTSKNLTFVESNAEEPWPFPQDHFDFIHGRMLIGAIHDWPSFLERCFTHLAPGGLLELPDTCFPWGSALGVNAVSSINSPFLTWGSLAGQAWSQAGFDNFHAVRHEYRLKRLGFVEVEHDETYWPVGPWSSDERLKKVGALSLRVYTMFIQNAGTKILTMNGFMEKEEAELLTAAALKDVQDNYMEKKFLFPIKITRAKKPIH